MAPIEDKLREKRLRWFGHIKRRPREVPVRKLEQLDIAHSRRLKGRPKNDMEASDRLQCQRGEEHCRKTFASALYGPSIANDMLYSSDNVVEPSTLGAIADRAAVPSGSSPSTSCENYNVE
ncbi:hypothetical protein DITRI_Ditri04bG0018500 [Diplodiscus trichospermus]